MINIFHQHNWVESERFYAPPREKIYFERSPESMQKLVFGQTTILYSCTDKHWKIRTEYNFGDYTEKVFKGKGCGKTYQETILGKSLVK